MTKAKRLDREKGVVSDVDRIRIRAAANGRIQSKMARDLIRKGRFDNPCPSLKGKAWEYASSYKRSYHNFADRVERHGIDLEYESGPCGGDYSSHYELA